ncbi:MAG: preprotein translocase subunit SecY [Flavobacteriales bacterium]|nr:preprotein translocase subunit SecY [Flavobacteriales bacterium]MBK7083645.1 preprotein translocase subunit SecY [Flavobacteriales bacterium]MBK7753480.1 preprotein translocase subunit SecY [Flavobacteriales bacterium]MBK9077084.1 preprotein translocase subunit SecY [Flavobacteriales bacterium]MBK9538504.1 preprotein translocase subunit SecY [Flavobacteriales bacterium]
MKNLIETVKNIWRIEELRNRILITLGLLLVYRIGSYIVLPGVDSLKMATASTGGGGIVEILSIFTGGAFTRASIFALGIMPYISASIIMQLMGIAVPAVQKMQREESGRRKLNQYTRYLTILICVFQAPGYIYATIDPDARPDSQFWLFTTVVILTCSTLFVMWLGERITERGLGNGISLIIMIGILAEFPQSFAQEVVGRMGPGGGGLVLLLVEVVLWVLIIAGCILLVQGTRRIPVQFAKRVQGNKQFGGVRNYIPLKVNAAGVMPIIFAQAIVLIPMYVAQAFEQPPQWLLGLANAQGMFYNLLLFSMVVMFTYFYTAITVNPVQLADDMKRNGGFIPGVKPGKQTADHIDELLSRITLPGAIFLGMVAILPAFAQMAGIKQGFAQFFGGTSLLIMVGVLLDTLQQIESHLLMRHYDGLMKTGRIKGRTNAAYGMAG